MNCAITSVTIPKLRVKYEKNRILAQMAFCNYLCRKALLCFFFVAVYAAYAREPVGIEWKWVKSGLFCELLRIAEWIYCVKQDNSYVLYINSHHAYSQSEAVYPLLFKIDDDPQITFKPREHFVPLFQVDLLPTCFPWIPLKKYPADGMKNFPNRDAYGKKNLFEDPDFPILRNRLCAIIQRYIQPLPLLQKRIDDLVKKMDQKEKIGIHVRGPTHYQGCRKTPDQFLEDIEEDVDRIMESKDPERTVIYLATLLDPLVKRLSAKYQVIAIDIPRCKSMWHDWVDIPNEDPLDIPRDAIVDAWTLSSCDEFWCSSSNMAAFICCINPNLKTRLLPSLSYYNGN